MKADVSTGVSKGVGRLGLGMASLGRPAYITVDHARDFPEGRSQATMRAQAERVLDAAFAAGVRYVDVARSYGDAEVFVGDWLRARGLEPGTLRVASKWGYVYQANWQLEAPIHERKEHSLAMLRRQQEESLSFLAPHLSLYQIHSATQESGVLEDSAILDELHHLAGRGIATGVTVTGSSQGRVIARAMAIERAGKPLFSSIQATWNLLERSAERELEQAHEAGFTVVVKEALANGLLTEKGGPGASGELADMARARGVSADAVALAAVLAQPWVDVVLLGVNTTQQLDSNLKALQLGLTQAELRRLSPLRVEPRAYWDARARLPWN